MVHFRIKLLEQRYCFLNTSQNITYLFQLGTIFKKAFPDSKIAEKFQCGRTKTACIIKKALAPHCMDMVLPTARDQLLL